MLFLFFSQLQLDEIKTKDKTIEILRKDVAALKVNQKHQFRNCDGRAHKVCNIELMMIFQIDLLAEFGCLNTNES